MTLILKGVNYNFDENVADIWMIHSLQKPCISNCEIVVSR